MYQSEIKEKFINDYMRSRVVAKTSLYSLFRKTEKYEEKLNKDCFQFTFNEVIEMYTDFQAKSVYTLMNYNVILKAYCAWNNYYNDATTEISYNNITRDMMAPLIPEYATNILSREDINDIEEQLLNWTDKAIVEALFEGLSGHSMTDLVGANMETINHRKKQMILSNGRMFYLTDRLYNLLMEAFSETEYVCYGTTMRVKKLYGFGSLYKERDNAHAPDSEDRRFRWTYRKIQNIRKHVGMENLTMKNLTISGLIYYLRYGVSETGLDLKSFLLTDDGNKIMDKYGYFSDFRVDNIVNRYGKYIQ